MMASTSTKQRLAEILAQCLAEMLGELGGAVERVLGTRSSAPTGETTAAFSGFGSTDLRGSFALTGPSALFARLHPLPPTETPRDLADWACELVNQTIGRFRNRLLGYGVSLAPGIPQSAFGEQVRLSSSLRPDQSPIAFAMDGMTLEGWLELDLRPGFELPENPSAEQAAAIREGSLIFL